nr:hypothetical protein [Tanacetum cinerariifolium]
MFRVILHLPVEIPDCPFIAPVNIETIEAFMKKVGYQDVIDKVQCQKESEKGRFNLVSELRSKRSRFHYRLPKLRPLIDAYARRRKKREKDEESTRVDLKITLDNDDDVLDVSSLDSRFNVKKVKLGLEG